MRYFKFFFFFSYKVFKILKTVNLYQDQLATLQVLWSHTWPVATGLDSTGIERAYDEEILYPMRLHFILFPRGNLCFNGLFILLSPPYFFLYMCIYTYVCLFYQFSDSAAHPTPWCRGVSCLAHLMTLGLNCSELFSNFFFPS